MRVLFYYFVCINRHVAGGIGKRSVGSFQHLDLSLDSDVTAGREEECLEEQKAKGHAR